MATDLNLHRKTASLGSDDSEDGRARDYEVHNRERTWLLCFCLDRSFSAQMGKPYSVKEEYVPVSFLGAAVSIDHVASSFVIRNAQQWARSSVSIPTDSGLAGYVVRTCLVALFALG
jgi:hypothetical protein